ncbi:MAG: phage protease [Luteolibacter sp.]|uniref:phage protease n=1 Tax=Luteolibacter sp. TaxID=1962973 RepID=UPI003267ADF5
MKNELHCSGRFRDLTTFNKTPKPWTHVASLGEFPGTVDIPAGYDVPGYGVAAEDMSVEGLTVFDAAVFESLVQSFEGDILIDADHLSHDMTQSTEALGWGHALRYGGDRSELELETPWTPPGREKITTQVYRYISPEFSGSVRYEAGVFKFYPTSLTGAGLTNRPKLKALRPVSANRKTESNKSMSTIKSLALLCGLLGVPETTPEAELETKTTAFKADVATSKNRAAEADKLETEVKVLRAEAIESDLETYAAVIEDKEAAKELLQLNRAATVKTFAAQMAKRGEDPNKPLFQKNRATPPDGKKFTEAEDDQKESKRTALVATVKNREKCDFQTAWTIAKGEKPELF